MRKWVTDKAVTSKGLAEGRMNTWESKLKVTIQTKENQLEWPPTWIREQILHQIVKKESYLET